MCVITRYGAMRVWRDTVFSSVWWYSCSGSPPSTAPLTVHRSNWSISSLNHTHGLGLSYIRWCDLRLQFFFFFLLLVVCMGARNAVAIEQCGHMHWIVYNGLVAIRKIAIAIAPMNEPFLRARLHCAICDCDLFLLTMGCTGVGDVVAVA